MGIESEMKHRLSETVLAFNNAGQYEVNLSILQR